jgi:hypothetical protein
MANIAPWLIWARMRMTLKTIILNLYDLQA